MRRVTKPKHLLIIFASCALVIGSLVSIAADGPEQVKPREVAPAGVLHLTLGTSIPLAVQSTGVEWDGRTNHLVKLKSIQFDLNDTNRLSAVIRAEVTMFDAVDYDVSGAVFDVAGQLLGTARTQCKVERMWMGYVVQGPRTISMDFGVSLDYPRARTFMVSISNRRVLTPDDWQK